MAESRAGGHLRIDHRYMLLEPIARGATATVHLGLVTGAQGVAKTVAIKRLHPHLAADTRLRAMLLEEARLASRISHPNVVSVRDVVESADEVFLVMEYVQGETLHRLLELGGRPPEPIAAAVVRDLLQGLHAAHHVRGEDGAPLGLVHRDVTPRNILVGRDGVARLLDFGIAKAQGQRTTTHEGFVRGTLAYMAPEQLHGESLTARSDLYAASVVLWEALTGQRLFVAETEAAVVARILEHDVRAVSSVVPELPRGLDAVVLRGLARDESVRFASGLEMALALEQATAPATREEVARWLLALAGDALAARDAAAAAVGTPLAEADGSAPSAAERPPSMHGRRGTSLPRRARRVAVGGVMSALGLAAVLGWASTRERGSPPRAVAAAEPSARGVTREPVGANGAASVEVPGPPGATEVAALPVPPRAPPPPAPRVASAPPARGNAVRATAAAVTTAEEGALVGAESRRAEPRDAGSHAAERAESCLPYYVDDAGRRRFDRACLGER